MWHDWHLHPAAHLQPAETHLHTAHLHALCMGQSLSHPVLELGSHLFMLAMLLQMQEYKPHAMDLLDTRQRRH
jgi:hypothetical protein